MGNHDRAARQADGDERIAKSLKNGMIAEKAATLTDRLLAFSRKQPLKPKRHGLNVIVSEFLSKI
ncbi:MAG: hypothetical protein M3Y22_14815 [Pseudomonadota bacterium]|nr:hypothetical protein [Pseudomonadota bacterium]